MFRLESLDILIIAIVLVLIFGAGRIGQVVRALGQAIHEFRNAVAGKDAESQDEKKENSSGT